MVSVFRSDSGGLYETNRTKIIKNILEESNVCDNKSLNIFQVTINQIIDHKGTLMIYWNRIPTKEEEEYFVKLWSIFGEDHIIHFLNHSEEI